MSTGSLVKLRSALPSRPFPLCLHTTDAYNHDTQKQNQKEIKRTRPKKKGRENQNQIKEDHSCVDNEGQTLVIVEIQIQLPKIFLVSKQEWAMSFFQCLIVSGRRKGSNNSEDNSVSIKCLPRTTYRGYHHIPRLPEIKGCRPLCSTKPGKGSVPAYSLCAKHGEFKCVPVVHALCTLSCASVMSDAVLAYVCVGVCLCARMCMFVHTQVCLHRDTRGQPQLLFLRCQLLFCF